MRSDLVSHYEAAELLDIDDAQLTRCVLAGELSSVGDMFHRVEVLAFRARRHANQDAALNEMLALSERNGWGNR